MYDKEENVNSLHYVCCFLENKISIPSRWDTPTEIHLNFPELNKISREQHHQSAYNFN